MQSVKHLLPALLLFVGAAALWYYRDLLLLLLAGGFLAFLLAPAVRRVQSGLHVRRGLATALVMLILLLLGMMILSALLSSVPEQLQSFAQRLNAYGADMQGALRQLLARLSAQHVPGAVLGQLEHACDELLQRFSAVLMDGASSLFRSSCLLDLVIIVTLAVYFLLDGRAIVRWFAAQLPADGQERFLTVVGESRDMVWAYLRAKTLVSAVLAALTYLLLLLLGVDYALFLALLTFVLDYIPYFGSLLAALAVAATALLSGGIKTALLALVGVGVLQQLDASVLSPKVQGGSVGIHPIAAILAVLAFHRLWGPLGMFLAVPLTAVGRLLLRELRRSSSS